MLSLAWRRGDEQRGQCTDSQPPEVGDEIELEAEGEADYHNFPAGKNESSSPVSILSPLLFASSCLVGHFGV